MSRAYTSRDEFVKAVTEGKVADDTVLRKQFVSEIAKGATEAGAPSRQFVVSTAAADRDNDCVSVSGWKLDNYKKNPVVLFAHDYSSLPIGKCTNIHTSKGQLVADMEFADHDMAKTVLKLVDGGFLNATSVGFRPLKYAMNEERRGMDFSEQELLEFSIVPVPANPEALIVARELMGDVALMKQWATTVLDVLKEAPLSSDSDLGEVDDKDKAPAKPGAQLPVVDPNDDDEGDQPPPKMVAALAAMPKLVADAVIAALKNSATPYCDCMKDPAHESSTCTCCVKGGCIGQCCMGKAVDVVVDKRGRVLSGKNEAKVRAAHQHLDEVLKSMPDYSSGDTEEDAIDIIETKSTDDLKEIVIDLDEVEKIEAKFEDMRDVLRDAFKDTVRAVVQDIVKNETTATLNRLRGRLD